MKNLSCFVFCCLYFSTCFSQQAPAIQWQNTIGGSIDDQLFSIQQTTDNGFILGGCSFSGISGDKTENSLGNTDYWIIKLDSIGNIQWQNTIGGAGFDDLFSVNQTIEGGYILGGYSDSGISVDKTENSMGSDDYWIVKVDSIGNIQWQNTIGGSKSDVLSSISQTSDKGYLLGGYSQSNISGDKTENNWDTAGFSADYWVVKVDSLGNIQWQNNIGGKKNDFLLSTQQTIDGGYILDGYSESNATGDKTENCLGDWDYWILKLDSAGNIQWQNTIKGNAWDQTRSIKQTTDGGYIVGGWSDSNISGDKTENCLGGWDYWVLKLDSSGNIQWQNTIGGNLFDYITSIAQTIDSGFILGGSSSSNISSDKMENSFGGDDYWIVKLNSIGNILWQKTIGGGDTDQLFSIQQANDGGYIFGGRSRSNISGNKTENSWNNSYDYWVIKLAPDTITGISPTPALPSVEGVAIAPNPASQYAVISAQFARGDEIRILNVLGETVFAKTFSSPSSGFRLLTSGFPQGIYFVEITTRNEKSVKKLVVQ